MSRADAMRRSIAAWCEVLPGEVLGGSLYAVEPELRVDAARALAEFGCGVHADLIFGADGEPMGISGDELDAVRDAVPATPIDVHVIVTPPARPSGDAGGGGGDRTARERVASALQRSAGLGVRRVAAAGGLLAEHREQLRAARLGGVELWAELAPHEDAARMPHADGALVMFIRPGSRDSADPSLVTRLPGLASRIPVGVDGGMSLTLARSCVEAGARHVVAGRNLLTG